MFSLMNKLNFYLEDSVSDILTKIAGVIQIRSSERCVSKIEQGCFCTTKRN